MTMVKSLTVFTLLVNLCWAAPAPAPSSSTNDILSGQDFLAVFMRSSQRIRSVPSSASSSSSYYINRNLIQQNKDNSDYEISDKDENNNSLYRNDENIIKSSSSSTSGTSTIIETSPRQGDDEIFNKEADKEVQTEVTEINDDEISTISTTYTTSDAVETTTATTEQIGTTTEQPFWEEADTELPSQVVSVRVSSSVVRQRSRQEEERPAIVTTQDEPILTAAAIQRSHFGVEESTGPVTYTHNNNHQHHLHHHHHQEPEERVSYSQEATVLRIEGTQRSSRRPILQSNHQMMINQQQQQQDSYAEASQEYASTAIVQPLRQQMATKPQMPEQNEHTLLQPINEKLSTSAPPSNYAQSQALTYHPIDLQSHPGNAPVTYETSVTSATSGSRVQFYSEPARYRLQPTEKRKDRRYYLSQFREKVYAEPEKNYEVDEAVSVITNGRAHGVQHHHTTEEQRLKHIHQQQQNENKQTPSTPQQQQQQIIPSTESTPLPGAAILPPTSDSVILSNSDNKGHRNGDDDDDNNKFGYVVDDRNYRKYRVEEKTPDGFIVGEYGVVSHDDGSLRGVRYTADSNISPRLIYDALVKFLSLK